MPSLTAKDRVSLCLFCFTDGRRCRTPRTGHHPHFCFFHAQKEARSQATEKISQDLAYLFSGDYLSACDLSTALSRLIPAVVRGDIKPRLARTVAYMFQTQLQAIHLSQREYANAFGTDGWRRAVRNSVNTNHDYLFPPDPELDAEQPTQSPAQSPAQPPAQPSTSTPAGAGQARPDSPDRTPQPPSRPQGPPPPPPQPPTATRPSPANVEAALSVARSLFPPHPTSSPAQSAESVANPPSHAPQPPSSTTSSATPTAHPKPRPLRRPPRPQLPQRQTLATSPAKRSAGL
jgi:hypothetical protein